MIDHSRKFQIFAHIIMILLSLLCLFPLVLLFISSITDEGVLIREGYSIIPRKIDLSAYRYLLNDANKILKAYATTAFVTAVGTIANVTLTTLLAYPLSRKDLPGRNFFAFVLFFTMIFGGGLVPTYIMWTQIFHIRDTIWALLVPGLLLNAFNVIMMRTYFTSTIPDAIVEAARIDGAHEVTIIRKIILPMSLPIMATIGLLVSLAYWNDFMNGFYYVRSQNLYTIQVLLNKMLLDTQFLQQYAQSGMTVSINMHLPSTALKMAVAVLGALPMLLVYPFFQKFFVKGIVVGGVKG
jgi:putative aldouronate transport system permease protein